MPQTWLRRGFATLLAYIAVQLMLSDGSKKVSAALPGMVAVGLLWAAYAVKRALGKRPPPPRRRDPPVDTEYFL